MFSRKEVSLSDRLLEEEIVKTIRLLDVHPITSEEYAKTLDAVIKLRGLRKEYSPASPSRDTLAVIGANLLGILMIIKHERVDIISQRALSLVLKPKI
jgi:hypothetical protein